MRRFARHLFTLCSVASLVLSVAAAVMWSRSYWHMTVVVFGHWPEDNTLRSWGLGSLAGGVELWSERYQGPVYGGGRLRTPWRLYEVTTTGPLSHDPAGATVSWGGFAYRPEKRHGYVPGWPRSWRVPYWFLVGVTAIPPALWTARAWKRRRRRGDGMCPTCGYDLRASPERCPECGAVPSAHS
jgi:hypothetical protein